LVEADFHLLVVGELAGGQVGRNVEPEDDRVGCVGQRDVGFGDAADRRVDDFRTDFRVLQGLGDFLLQDFERTRDVRLQDDLQRIALQLLEELFERHVALLREFLFAQLTRARVGDFLRRLDRVEDEEAVAGPRKFVETRDLDGGRRAGFRDEAAAVTLDRAHAPGRRRRKRRCRPS
jgi:hypothetical protein